MVPSAVRPYSLCVTVPDSDTMQYKPAPNDERPNEIVARRLLKQAEWCGRLGSRLYSTLLRQAAGDVRAAGVCYAVLHDHYDDSPDSALALRFLGAVHRLVLQGKGPELAACYPSTSGVGDCDL